MFFNRMELSTFIGDLIWCEFERAEGKKECAHMSRNKGRLTVEEEISHKNAWFIVIYIVKYLSMKQKICSFII